MKNKLLILIFSLFANVLLGNEVELKQNMIRKGRVQNDSSGFTLIEILIVVIILGVLAMIIVPQINVSSGEARLNTLKTNLKTVRKAIELYYHQHNNTYPGAVNMNGSGEGPPDANLTETFVYQLIRYTQLN